MVGPVLHQIHAPVLLAGQDPLVIKVSIIYEEAHEKSRTIVYACKIYSNDHNMGVMCTGGETATTHSQ